VWRPKQLIFFAITLGLLVWGDQVQGQNPEQSLPVPVRSVAFISESRQGLDTAQTTNVGDDGITRLVDLFVELGANVSSITLDSAIADEFGLVVLIGPKRSLSAAQSAYLWDFLQGGGHLLLALDPNGHNNTRTESARSSGISQLLHAEYGISILDDLWVESWFGRAALTDIVTSWSEAAADNLVPHPITEPLVTYDLPLRFWGGRSVFVDGLTGLSDTNGLIVAETPYGETSRIDLRSADAAPPILNIGSDNQGKLLLATIAENHETRSRVALIGDSEIFQNLFGLTRISNVSDLPRYPADFLFAQRLIAWLMGIPETAWPTLPQEFTSIALDGLTADWPENVPETTDLIFDTQANGYDIRQIQALHNDQFLYIAVETLGTLPQDAGIRIEMNDGVRVILENDTARVARDNALAVAVGDAAAAIATDAEIRIPLRIVGLMPVIEEICTFSPTNPLLDCTEETVSSTRVSTIEPVPVRFGAQPAAFLINEANLRTGPSTSSPVILQLRARSLFSVAGRNEAGDWLKLQNGRYEGWAAAFLVATNTDVERLPVVES